MTFDTHLKFAYILQSNHKQFRNLPLFKTSFLYSFNEHLSITVNAKNRTIWSTFQKKLNHPGKKTNYEKYYFLNKHTIVRDCCHFSHEYPYNMCFYAFITVWQNFNFPRWRRHCTENIAKSCAGGEKLTNTHTHPHTHTHTNMLNICFFLATKPNRKISLPE